jgi:hypothetical protein
MLYDPKWKKHQEKQNEDWRKILLDAADVIEKDGWIQGRMRDKNGYCIHGAINEVSKNRLYQRALAKLELWRMISGQPIGRWNDADGRTKGQVLFVLRAAAWK